MGISELIPAAARRFVSIDFGQAYLKIVYGRRKDEGIDIIAYDIRRLMFGGEKKGEIIDFITQFMVRNSIGEKEVMLTVSDLNAITIKHLIMPYMPPDLLPKAVSEQLKSESLFLKENSMLDWQVTREFSDAGGLRKSEVVCVFARSAALERYLSLLKECSLKPLRISSSPFNYAHILKQTTYGSGVIAVFDMGFRDATLSIYKQHKLIFIRNLAFSSDKLTQAMTGTVFSGSGTLELSYEKAEEIKRAFGIPRDDEQRFANLIESAQILEMIKPFLEGMARELKAALDYFAQHFKETRSQVLYITGGGANVGGLAHRLGKDLGLDVCVLPLPRNVGSQAIDRDRLARDHCQLMSAVGCVLSDAESIDLTPAGMKMEKIRTVEEISLKFSVMVLVVVFLSLLGFVNLQTYQYRVRLNNMRMHVQALSEVGVLKEKIDARVKLIMGLRAAQVPADGLLRVLGARTPHGIILEELTLDQARRTVLLRGIVRGGDEPGKRAFDSFNDALRDCGYFREVSPVFMRAADRGQEFQLRCDLAY